MVVAGGGAAEADNSIQGKKIRPRHGSCLSLGRYIAGPIGKGSLSGTSTTFAGLGRFIVALLVRFAPRGSAFVYSITLTCVRQGQDCDSTRLSYCSQSLAE